MNIGSYIDHTVLKQTTTGADVAQLCAEAKEWGFAAVCVPPLFVKDATFGTQNTSVAVATVVGFPWGYQKTIVKLTEAQQAIEDGATEIDMVTQVGKMKEGDWQSVENDISYLLKGVHGGGAKLKVIVESGVLSEDELSRVCSICGGLGVDFVKTSTGFAERGATLEAVQTMRRLLPPTVRIKASGGIRDLAFAQALIRAGADRIGASASVAMMKEQTEQT